MREPCIWLGEIEDKLRIAPCSDRDRRPAVADQHVAGGLDWWTVDVRPNEERAALNPLFPALGLAALEPRMLQGASDIAGRVAGRFAERRGKWSIRDDRAHAWNHNRHGCGKMRRELP